MDYRAFRERVQSMSAREIIMAMVDSLRNPVTTIDMRTFGTIYRDKCYGCAATNTICKLADIKIPSTFTDSQFRRVIYNSGEDAFLISFESAIDCLRLGHVDDYNYFAKQAGCSLINVEGFYGELPELDNDFSEGQLQIYERLAEMQDNTNHKTT